MARRVPFFFKQWGGPRPKSRGRLLDGEEWNEFPWQIAPDGILHRSLREALDMANHQKHYKGREQSYIKHYFLRQYLELAAFKTLQGSSPTFNFVDAFAGPWSVADASDYSDASFDQALNTLEGVRVHLARRGLSGLKVRFCFCERDTRSAEKLRRYAEKKRGFEIHVFPGTFEDNLDNVAAQCKAGFTFTFIDPTGWNIDSAPVLKFLSQSVWRGAVQFHGRGYKPPRELRGCVEISWALFGGTRLEGRVRCLAERLEQ